MNKSTRYSFIANLCAKVSKPKVSVLQALPVEIEEEVALASKHNDDNSILDVDANIEIISPLLSRVTGEAKRMAREENETEDNFLLSLEQKKLLARELNAYRVSQKPSYNPLYWLVPVNTSNQTFA